jgi:hypothetical protein
VIRYIFLQEPVATWPQKKSGGWATRRLGSLKSGRIMNTPQIQAPVKAYWYVSKGDLVNVVKSNYDYLVDLIVESDTVDTALTHIEKASEYIAQELDISAE